MIILSDKQQFNPIEEIIMKKLRSAKINELTLNDKVWKERLDNTRKVTVPSSIARCRETGRLEALKLNWDATKDYKPHVFWDSDVAKVLEGIGNLLGWFPNDPELLAALDEIVELFVGAQQEDGYLNSCYTQLRPDKRWSDLYQDHELYCAGHLMEAAVAIFENTGDRRLLDVVCKFADYIETVFGHGPGQIPGYCGHEEIELALFRLADATGCERYRKLAAYFIEERGQEPNYFYKEQKTEALPYDLECFQAHKKVRDEEHAVGHAVRMVYLQAAVADYAAYSNDTELAQINRRVWENMVQRRMYITGGIGDCFQGERLTVDWHLPNDSMMYAESCAAMGVVRWASRMLNYTGDGEYGDVLERTLYNGVLAGISLEGDHFFYTNYLEVNEHLICMNAGAKTRQPWFQCSCCPTSFSRFIPELPRFAWSVGERVARLNLPLAGSAEFEASDGGRMKFTVEANYPWSGKVVVTAKNSGNWSLALRIPAWTPKFSLKINGESVDAVVEKGFVTLEREWCAQDQVELVLDMPVAIHYSNVHLTNNAGRVVLRRGPVVYALESVDNPAPLGALYIDASAPIVETGLTDLPGVTGLKGRAYRAVFADNESLYPERAPKLEECDFIAVPYGWWQNRGAADMQVWLNKY